MERRWITGAVLFLAGGVFGAPMPKSTLSGEEVLRLNCGAQGWDYTDPRGNFWLMDETYLSLNRWGYTNGNPQNYEGIITIPPGLTDISPVYQTVRSGNTSMKYEMDLPNGRYQVVLHFLEPFFSAANKRIFDVALQGTVVIDDLDVFSRAGGKARPFSQTFAVDVVNEKLVVSFPEIKKDVAIISGIEVKVQSVTDSDFLSFLQRKMFWYFWNEAGPTTGLISDKSNNWAGDNFLVASIATTGFGLSILTVAAERGWITSEQARQRIHTTLNFFRQMQLDATKSYHGLWYHFVHRNTGAREWGSEISTVDSALFIMGALQAGEYFRSVDPTIAQKAEQMYKDMEWDWFAQKGGNSPFLSMGWKPARASDATISAPDRGYFIPYYWDNNNESVFVSLMALGSPTHSLSTRAWTEMRRHHVGSAGEGYSEYMHFPPLFVHQYGNLYIDFRNKHDGMADYWDAAVRATKKDRAQCAGDPLFEPDIWGLTACEIPEGGYEVFGTDPWGYSRGVAAPTGPLASLPMTPSESIASGRKMFFQYKHAIWGRHGFTDSFSVSEGGRATNALGLDNGPIVLAIENYRSNLVRDTFMRSPYVATALSRAGFMGTEAGPRHFAHSEKNNNRAQYAFDRVASTSWESTGEDDQWLAVDYGKPTSFDFVRLAWGSIYGKEYVIETSNDGDSWSAVGTVINGNGGEDIVRFPRTTARMARWRGTLRSTADWGVGYVLKSLEFVDEFPPPPAPLAPTVLARTVDSITWGWNDVPSEFGYRVRRVSDNEVLVDNLAANTTYWARTGLGGNVGEQVRVEAYNATGSSVSSDSGLVHTLAYGPTEAVLQDRGGGWILTWKGDGNSSGTRYEAEQSNDGVAFVGVYEGTDLTTPVGPLAFGSTHYFRVRAKNGNDLATGYTAWVQRYIPGSVETAPTAPSGVEVTDRGTDRLTWTWDDNSNNEEGFRVRRAVDNAVLDSLPADTRSWVQRGLNGNQGAVIVVEAFNSFGNGTSAESDEFVTLANSPEATSAEFENGRWSLMWSDRKNTGNTPYSVYRSVDNVSFTEIYHGSDRELVLPGLEINKTYFFKVRAYNSEFIPSPFDVTVSTRIHTLNVGIQGPPLPTYSGDPSFAVSFSAPPPAGETILLDPLDAWPGPAPESWRPVNYSWDVSTENNNAQMMDVRLVYPSNGPGYLLAQWEETTSTWVNRGPSAQTNGGIFGVFYNPPTSLESVRVYPNPLRRSSGNSVRIEPIPQGTQVRIFTVSGENVRELSPTTGSYGVLWDGRNTSGDSVAAGVYFGIMDGGGEKKTFRLVVQ